jgi:glutamate---cysteine ligase / carboxylate-amine ligase
LFISRSFGPDLDCESRQDRSDALASRPASAHLSRAGGHALTEPEFTIGIEEEYLLVDRDSLDLAEAPEALMEACRAEFADQVSPEFLQCQIEVGTRVCRTVGEAREDLRRLRAGVARHAARHGLAPIAVSCHPFADWKASTTPTRTATTRSTATSRASRGGC